MAIKHMNHISCKLSPIQMDFQEYLDIDVLLQNTIMLHIDSMNERL